MYKRIILAVFILIMALNAGGCTGALRRKFIRKKKGVVREAPVLQPHDYKKEFTNRQFYANHFAFWKSAESEVLSQLKNGGNAKRLNTYMSYAQVELRKLYNLLAEEKQKEMSPLMDELEGIAAKIKDINYVNSNRNLLANDLRLHYRSVDRGFSYHSMKGFIRENEPAADKPQNKENDEPAR